MPDRPVPGWAGDPLRRLVVSRRLALGGALLGGAAASGLASAGRVEARLGGPTRSGAARAAVDPASLSWVATRRDAVALTFDDGPDPATTPAVLDLLARHGCRGTFFVIGSQVGAHPDIVRRLVEEGHTLANHTYDHAHLDELGPDEVLDQLRRGREAIEAFGDGPRYARPPRGYTTPVVAAACERLGERQVFWSRCLEACSGATDAARGLDCADGLVPGDIVLVHDGGHNGGRWAQTYDRRPSVRALGPFLGRLRSSGLAGVTLPDLLGASDTRRA